MGRRFLARRFPLARYSDRRAWFRLNEAKSEPHQMRSYGLASGKFSYRQLFQKKRQSRPGNRRVKRTVKKTVRQRARRELQENAEDAIQ